MTTLTIELPPALSQELQASGISHQQLQTLVTHFIQIPLSLGGATREENLCLSCTESPSPGECARLVDRGGLASS